MDQPHDSASVENRGYDTLSNYSTNSTNQSSKQSPEYGDHDGDGRAKAHPVKKKIHKYYEPLIDNNVVYRYEDDPVEYKKARAESVKMYRKVL